MVRICFFGLADFRGVIFFVKLAHLFLPKKKKKKVFSAFPTQNLCKVLFLKKNLREVMKN